jgi:hypothetical protein
MQPFNVADFLIDYPQFVGQFSDSRIEGMYYNEALTQGSKIIGVVPRLSQYYWSCQVLAHILTLYTLGLTSRTISATEGSVTGGFESLTSSDKEWWMTTIFGTACWHQLQKRGGATYFGTLCNRDIWGINP